MSIDEIPTHNNIPAQGRVGVGMGMNAPGAMGMNNNPVYPNVLGQQYHPQSQGQVGYNPKQWGKANTQGNGPMLPQDDPMGLGGFNSHQHIARMGTQQEFPQTAQQQTGMPDMSHMSAEDQKLFAAFYAQKNSGQLQPQGGNNLFGPGNNNNNPGPNPNYPGM